jgi:flagellar motor switch protein FliM
LQDLLSQEEIDALLNGIDGEVIPDDTDEEQLSEVVAYEPGEMHRIERSDLPGLELFSQRLSRQLQAKLFKWFELPVTVSPTGCRYSNFEDYQETVAEPSSLSLLQLPPLHGTSVTVLDSKLVFKLVEQFFGGAGGHARIQSRDFSALELRVTALFLEHLFSSMIYAWQPLLAVNPSLVGSEKSIAAIAHIPLEEPLLVVSFEVSFDGSGGELQWLVPYSMLEPLMEKLRGDLASGSDTAPGYWHENLENSLRASKVKMSYGLSTTQMSLRNLLALKAGDIVPIDGSSGVVRVNARELFAARLSDVPGSLSLELEGRVDQ